ncbi:MAG: nuclear transport factor 2 family protein [Bacteroidota bacterium]
MKYRIFMLFALLTASIFSQSFSGVNHSDEIKKVAEDFIKAIDANDSRKLEELLHPDMLQYVRLNGKLIAFKASDFIQMIADKKIGGVPRKMTHHSAQIVRGATGQIVLQAVSEEYDFMYQMALAKNEDNWLIVGILVDVVKL